MPSNLTQLGAVQLAACIARGETTAVNAVEQHIARIAEVNPRLNAMTADRFDAAREEAKQADARQRSGAALGPLHGVPVTIKECLDLQGTASTFGLESRTAHRAAQDE